MMTTSAEPQMTARWKTAPLFDMSPLRITTNEEMATPIPMRAMALPTSPPSRPSSSFTNACSVTEIDALTVSDVAISSMNSTRSSM